MGLSSSSYEFKFESGMFLFSSSACFKQSGGSFLQLQLISPTLSPRCVRSYTVVLLAIDCASTKVLISHILRGGAARYEGWGMRDELGEF